VSHFLQNQIQAPVGDSFMVVHVYGPDFRQEIKAVIVLMFPRSGMDGFPQRIANGLSQHGFVVLVPDITHRVPNDVPIRDRKRLLTDVGVIEDVGAVISIVESSAWKDKPRFIMGHCMGGRNALLGASIFDFAGVVTFYGGEMFDAWGGAITPFSRLQNIKCPILGFFGGNDKNPSPADAEEIKQELLRARVEHRFETYKDVGHAFQQNAGRSPEERQAADDSTGKMIGFLMEQCARQIKLRQGGPKGMTSNVGIG
jgi:carboxymethylenebutenolidase